MDEVTGQFLDDDTQPGYPIVPPIDSEGWRSCRVIMDDGDLSHLCSFPRNKKNYPLVTIANEDLIAIQPGVRYGDWVAARVKRQVGWLNSKHLELHPEPIESVEQSETSIYDTQEIEVDPAQRILLRMKKSRPNRKQEGFYLTTREFNRIKRFMRGISSTLQHARRRNERSEE